MSNLFDLVGGKEQAARQAYCEKHGPYLSICLFGKIWSSCPSCEAERQKEEEEKRARLIKERANALWARRLADACIPPRYQNKTFETFDHLNNRDAFESALQYAKDFEEMRQIGRSVIFIGPPGVGKTHLACAIAQYVIKGKWSALYTTAPKMTRRLMDAMRWDSRELLSDATYVFTHPDLLIIDEIGSTTASEIERVRTFDVINERYEQVKPTIIISNHLKDDIEKYLGHRIMDRLSENGGFIIRMSGESYRRKR